MDRRSSTATPGGRGRLLLVLRVFALAYLVLLAYVAFAVYVEEFTPAGTHSGLSAAGLLFVTQPSGLLALLLPPGESGQGRLLVFVSMPALGLLQMAALYYPLARTLRPDTSPRPLDQPRPAA